MANIIDYARLATGSFAQRPLCRVDSLCLSWLAYLRYPATLGADSFEGVRLADLADPALLPLELSSLHDTERSEQLVRAVAASPRFGEVRAYLHASESDEEEGKQFSATAFRLPDGLGTYVAYRGTDDSLVGWKENFRLACATAVPAQRRALSYLDQLAYVVDGPLWAGGHSKGGNLAEYACRMATDEVRERIVACYTHDGPGFRAEVRADEGWHDDVPVHKTVPRAALVGMLFERSQQGITVVRSSAAGVMQHAPLSWEVGGTDFVCEQGMDYDAWKLAQRLNDWLCDMSAERCERFAELLGWLVDVTAEPSFSSLLRRWSTNRNAMRAALAAAPADDRALFEQTMDDLVATVLLGSRQEHGITDDDTPAAAASAAARKIEDLSARANDHLAKLERLTGGR